MPPRVQIYVAAHKPYAFPADSAYVPLQVGAALHEPFCTLRDDMGENISARNASYCELTALYWMWKHAQADFVGLAHYRRYLAAPQRHAAPRARILSGPELERLLARDALLLPRRRRYFIETNLSQYAHAHHVKDLLAARDVILSLYPGTQTAFDAVMRRRSGHRFNMLVMRRDMLSAYCAWLFPILFALEARLDTSAYDDYNRRVIGFIAERLLDVWIAQNNLPYRELPVVDLEPVNWPRKGARFCLRKLRGTLQPAHGGLRRG